MWQGLYMGRYLSHASWNGKKKMVEYEPEGVVENNEVKPLWDMNAQCDIRLLRQVLRTWMCRT